MVELLDAPIGSADLLDVSYGVRYVVPAAMPLDFLGHCQQACIPLYCVHRGFLGPAHRGRCGCALRLPDGIASRIALDYVVPLQILRLCPLTCRRIVRNILKLRQKDPA